MAFEETTDDAVEFQSSSTVGMSSIGGIIPFLWKCGCFVSVLVFIAIGILYAKQDSLLYFPEIGGVPRRPGSNPRRYRSPAEHKIPYETHMIVTEDGVTIHSWLLLHPRSQQDKIPTIIFFHGNAGNIGLRIPNALQMFYILNINILMVEYRGYGDSDSVSPTESGLKLDAEASLRFLQQHTSIDNTRIFLFGRSLGGAVAFHLAHYAQKNSLPLAGLIIENTFLSISEMVDHLMPYISLMKVFVLKIYWDSAQIAPKIDLPILYLSGGADTLVPPIHMKKLYDLSRKNSICAKMHIVKDGTHNETWLQGGSQYWEKIKQFMAEAIAIPKSGSFSSVSDVTETASSKLTVNMGTELPHSSMKNAACAGSSTASIPLIPNNLIGIAKEAAGVAASLSSSSDGGSGKKKKN